MSKIGKNIRKIRVIKQLSQASFAQIFNLARPSVGAYEEGRAEPKIDTVVQIAQYFGISTDALLTKELTINELYRFDALKNKKNSSEPDNGLSLKKDIFQNTVAVFIGEQINYIHDHLKTDYIDGLPRYHFPGISSLSARLFEVEGDSMSFDNKGIHHGDIVLCEFKLDRSDNFQADLLYELVLPDRLVLKRFKPGGNKLVFTCDNPDFPNEEYESSQILEAWQVKALYTRSIASIKSYKERITDLEEQFSRLTSRIEIIEKSSKNIP
jgi:transcriptional regulator with XRE-family HTH domain